MKPLPIELPTVQNWSCHGCTDCCRDQLVVMLSAGEKERIEKQNWTEVDGVDPSAMVVAQGDGFRLGHQNDGACVFLDAAGRCRIHTKFGEAAKPLACRLYPFVIHPAGKKLVVGLRFSCPSAAANRGKPMVEQGAEIQKLAALVVPEDYKSIAPPPVLAAPGIEWPDFLRFIKWVDTSLAANDVPVALKLLRALHWLGKVEKGGFDQIAGDSADEILGPLFDSAAKKLPTLPEVAEKPSRVGRLLLRILVLEHARQTTMKDLDSPSRHRWKMVAAVFRFVRSSGRTPALRDGLAEVKFSDIEKNFGPLSTGAEAALTRFFRVKIQSLHFCGRAFHDRPLIEGFRSLALLYPVIIWLSRWQAVSDGRASLSDTDIIRAISVVDYHHGYSPYSRWRVSLLNQRNDIARLCSWYAR